MSGERWQEIERLFNVALDLDGPDRERFLDRACIGEPALRAHVEALLRNDEAIEHDSFLRTPALGERFLVPPPDELVSSSQATVERVGKYRIRRWLAEGGMGAVYLAERDDGAFEQTVAVKLLNTRFPSSRLVRRFQRERQTLANLNHPNIARLLDGGVTSDGAPYLVMEYVDGLPIDAHCRRHRLTIRQRLSLFLRVCDAVQYAHQNLIVHRDLKPTNILVTDAGIPKLVDFGIAKVLETNPQGGAARPLTGTMPIHTPEYASPEQLSHKPITTATDVYSLGVILYELLAGVRPYQVNSRSPAEVERVVSDENRTRPSTAVRQSRPNDDGDSSAHVQREVADPAILADAKRWRRQLRGDLDNIVLTALRSEPARRYTTAARFADDIRCYLRGRPVTARRETIAYQLGKFISRNRILVGAAAIVLFLLVAGLITTIGLAHHATMERNAALTAQAAEAAQRLRAQEAEREAATEAIGAQTVSSFLVDLFAAADPYDGAAVDLTARELVRRGARRVETELVGQPGQQAVILNALGKVHVNLGLYREAEGLFQRALERQRMSCKEPRVREAEILAWLGSVRTQLGRHDAARTALEEAMAVHDRLDGAYDDTRAQILENMGALETQVGAYGDARDHLEQALGMYRDGPKGDDRAVSDVLSLLARLEFDRGEYAAAEALLLETLAIRQRMFGEDDPRLAHTMQDLGAVLHMQGRLDEAEAHYRQALEVLRDALGERHPRLLGILSNLAALALDKGDPAAAETMYSEVLAIQREEYGEEHPDVAASLAYLGIIADAAGETERAERRLREALRIQRVALPEDHLDTALTLSLLGDLLAQTGRPSEGEPLIRESLAIRRSTLSDDHWQTAVSKSILGDCLTAAGRLDEAEPLLIESLDVITDAFGPAHEQTSLAPGSRQSRPRTPDPRNPPVGSGDPSAGHPDETAYGQGPHAPSRSSRSCTSTIPSPLRSLGPDASPQSPSNSSRSAVPTVSSPLMSPMQPGRRLNSTDTSPNWNPPPMRLPEARSAPPLESKSAATTPRVNCPT
jgi:serine/threonine protein kinase/tetratricopeptide (TPR) repeat protein